MHGRVCAKDMPPEQGNRKKLSSSLEVGHNHRKEYCPHWMETEEKHIFQNVTTPSLSRLCLITHLSVYLNNHGLPIIPTLPLISPSVPSYTTTLLTSKLTIVSHPNPQMVIPWYSWVFIKFYYDGDLIVAADSAHCRDQPLPGRSDCI